MARYELDQRQRLLVDQHGSAAELSPATVMQFANARSLTVAKGTEARKHEFVALPTARQRVSLESEIVRTGERGLGRTARPFELDIRLLPVASVQAWRLSCGRALVTRALFRDRAAYGKWLRPIIEELA